MSIPRRSLVAIFPSRQDLVDAVDHLADSDLLNIERTAVIAKAEDGETVVLDNHVTPNEAGIAGGTMGAAMMVLGMTQFGALTIPGAGPLVSIGAGVLMGGLIGRQTGRLAVHLMNLGFDEEETQKIGESLQSGQAALIIEADTEQSLGKVQQALKKKNVEVIERAEDLQSFTVENG